MWYKFGAAKISLRAGKMLGMAAGLLILLQLPLAGRLKSLDRIFSLPGLIRQHRWHAWAIVLMALIHPLCVLLAEGKMMIPLEMRYWPEWVGVGLLAVLLVQFACTQWRRPLKIAFHHWLTGHRITGLMIAALLIVHVLYVSETFTDNPPPRLAVLAAAGVFTLFWLWVRSAGLRNRRRPFTVTRVENIGRECTCVEVAPEQGISMAYLPGQFAFVSFTGQHLSREPHPFTLASTPSRPGVIQFAIRHCGDWTRQVDGLAIGDRAYLQGPFGCFSHLLHTSPQQELIMIAGGIGITPMLSMLRFMADHGDPRPITLIWSNRSREHLVFTEAFEHLTAKLTGLRRVPIFTQHTDGGKPSERLNRKMLETLLGGCSRKSAVFLCGPPSMMTTLATDLKALGFSARSVITEAFGF
ncbi:ferric reductase-like transmembrane domain-containing protein [uncultured Desulfosarcina sp.]|uniref:ferredoxin reductase family protein n=1 Tax=uncultured Desulfosarcina sp. TaxID=218289 RepID=UPI0029C8C1A0|nr:FAD-binding oxidoreductase [uncultured Desulfosarcina sp.]